ncbi:hypothetical protein ACJJTC_011983 [Scirpophaga incertulas]
MRLIYKPPRRMEHRVPARLAFAKLIHNEDTQQELDAGFGAAVSTADDNLATDAKWQNYADILHRVAQQVVGKPQKKNHDWFDESDSEIRRLVERSRLALGGAIDARHRSSIQRDLKVKIRGVKDSWWRHKAEELQWLADTSQTAKFFEGLKCVYGLRTKKTSPVYSLMKDAVKKSKNQIFINVRLDKSVFDLTRLKAKRKVHSVPVTKILYADDVCHMADSLDNLQTYLDHLDHSCRKYGLVISASKTQVLKQPSRGKTANENAVYLNRKPLDEVGTFSMSSESWEELATKRTEWRTAVKTGLENFESTRLEELDSKRQHRKTRPKPSYDYTYDSNGNLYCASCNRTFKSMFGFASHARAHARRDQGMS